MHFCDPNGQFTGQCLLLKDVKYDKSGITMRMKYICLQIQRNSEVKPRTKAYYFLNTETAARDYLFNLMPYGLLAKNVRYVLY